MFDIDSEVFLQVPEETEARILHRAVVTDRGKTVTVRPDDPELGIRPGRELLVYRTRGRHFLKQPVRVAAVTATAPSGQLIVLETAGDPVPADSRKCYRVPTIVRGPRATLGSETSCTVADVSVEGLSVIARQRHSRGDVVPLSIEFEGSRCQGQVCVQSVKELDQDRIRYGLLAREDLENGRALRKALQQMTMSIQRRQLRRRTGS